MIALITMFAKFIGPIFAGASDCSTSFFFILPSWWEYLPAKDIAADCSISISFPNDLWLIGFALLDMLLRVAGLVAVVSIIIAGFGYITSGGNTDNAAKARRRIYNAAIGLAIVFVAVGLVRFVGNSLKG